MKSGATRSRRSAVDEPLSTPAYANMSDPLIIKHPLEECVRFGNICDLDLHGRNSLDLIMTMIGDMQFRSDSINGTCARYFLLVDLSILQNLCVSAHIDCDKLRDHICRCDRVEVDKSNAIYHDRQTGFLFAREEEPLAIIQDPRMEAQLRAVRSCKQEAKAEDIVRPPYERSTIRAVQHRAENCELSISRCTQ
jgi:hypothetical protein